MMFRSIYSHGIPFLVGFSSHKGISEDGDVKLYPTQGPRCEVRPCHLFLHAHWQHPLLLPVVLGEERH